MLFRRLVDTPEQRPERNQANTQSNLPVNKQFDSNDAMRDVRQTSMREFVGAELAIFAQLQKCLEGKKNHQKKQENIVLIE